MCGQSLSAILRHRAGICWTVARWTIPACRLLLVLVGDLAVLVGASEIGVRLEWRVGPQDDVVRGQPGLIRSHGGLPLDGAGETLEGEGA